MVSYIPLTVFPANCQVRRPVGFYNGIIIPICELMFPCSYVLDDRNVKACSCPPDMKIRLNVKG